jgi:hypothetical protein
MQFVKHWMVIKIYLILIGEVKLEVVNVVEKK